MSLANIEAEARKWKSKAHEWMVHGESVGERAVNTGIGLAVCAGLGAARAKWGTASTVAGAPPTLHLPGTEIEGPLAIAALAAAAGIVGLAGKVSDQITSAGSHTLGVYLEEMMRAKLAAK